MNIRPIKTAADYEWGVSRINELMDAEPDSKEEIELDILSTLLDQYESKNFPIEAPDPIEAIIFRMEQRGLERKDLEPIFGTRARTSEILNRKRPLSLKMIRRLNRELDIPLDALIAEVA